MLREKYYTLIPQLSCGIKDKNISLQAKIDAPSGKEGGIKVQKVLIICHRGYKRRKSAINERVIASKRQKRPIQRSVFAATLHIVQNKFVHLQPQMR